jgi:uncharacterized membrane protein YfcA
LPLVGGGLVGAVVGQRLAPHLPELRLRQGFAALLIGSALLTGYEAWQRHGHPPGVSRTAASRQPLLPPGWSSPPVSPLLLSAAAPPPTRHG